jgi:hypothetical protein
MQYRIFRPALLELGNGRTLEELLFALEVSLQGREQHTLFGKYF